MPGTMEALHYSYFLVLLSHSSLTWKILPSSVCLSKTQWSFKTHVSKKPPLVLSLRIGTHSLLYVPSSISHILPLITVAYAGQRFSSCML